ncbi:MAG TPA: LuxR C-terminal-related transcriptional regulator [Pilimelia sp.]|nr:LuxR C-terminal-related transcriptional regulator [Pilimelia sp.]
MPGPIVIGRLAERAATGIPELPIGHIVRERLVGQLEAAVHRPVTLVTAPAGWGKTTALATWARAGTATGSVRWVEAGPQHRVDLPERLLAALRDDRPDPDAGGSAYPDGLGGGAATGRGGPWLPPADLPNRMAEAARSITAPRVLVVDDLQPASDPAVLAAIEAVVRLGSPALRVVIASRTEPDLPLHRWRVSGALAELHTETLALTLGETSALFAAHGVVLPEADCYAVHARAEGWPAGVRLAAVALATAALERAPATSPGFEAAVAAYLVAEVLEPLPTDLRDRLTHCAVSPRLTTGLVEAITGTDAWLMAAAARLAPFLSRCPGPGGWYRFHPLFGRTLYRELRRRWPERLAELHGRAAHWHALYGVPAEALRHALLGQDWTTAVQVLDRHWADILSGVRFGRADDVAPEPPAGPPADPRLMLAFAAERLYAGDVTGARGYLGRLEHPPGRSGVGGGPAGGGVPPGAGERPGGGAETHGPVGDGPGGVAGDGGGRSGVAERVAGAAEAADAQQPPAVMAAACRAGEAWLAGEPARTLAAVHRVRGGATPPSDDTRALVLAFEGGVRMRLGDLAAAGRPMHEAYLLAQRAGMTQLQVAAASRLAMLESLRGRLNAAARISRQALATADRFGITDATDLGWVRIALANVYCEWNRVAEADRLLDEAIDLAVTDPDILTSALTVRARLRLTTGRLPEGLEAVDAARQGLTGAPPPAPAVARALRLTEAELRAGAGDVSGARRLLATGEHTGIFAGWAAVVEAALAIAEGRSGSVPDLLAPYLCDDAQSLTWTIQAALLTALAGRAIGDRARVVRGLDLALRLAEREGFRRPFLLGGHAARALLAAYAPLMPDYPPIASELISDLPDLVGGGSRPRPLVGAGERLVEPLTDRELTILRYLQGTMSNPEIAATLYVSVNTVKTHIKSIYRKLQAGRRRDAVERARELRLL